MLSRIEATDRRTLLVGAVIVATILLLGRGLPRVRAWEASGLAAAAAAERAVGYARRTVALDAAIQSAAAIEERIQATAAPALFPGQTPDEAAAGLIRLLGEEADAAGVRITSNAVRADTMFEEAYAIIAARVIATTDVRGLAEWLHQLERGPMLLRVRELTVTQPDPAADDRMPESLNISALVEGLARPGPALGGKVP